MEEGGGTTIEEITKRINAWEKLGSNEVNDVFVYHQEIGITKFFKQDAKLQSTWSKLIRIYLNATNQACNSKEVLEFQKIKLGRKDSDTCILELFPLASKSLDSWIYPQISDLPFLKDKQTYQKYVEGTRITKLKNRIFEHQPKVIVFYGSQYKDYWTKIAGIKIWNSNEFQVQYGERFGTLYLIVSHPVSFGVTNEYFDNIGKFIRNELGIIK